MSRNTASARHPSWTSALHSKTLFRAVATLLLLPVFLTFAGCANAQEPMRLPVEADKLVVTDTSGTEITTFSIEIARTEEQRSAGLMFRTDLPKDRGMLFYFPDEAQRFFWMENTPTPLDILYADSAGKIVHIAKNTVPFSRAPIPSQLPAQFAFEIHAGLSETLGIQVGFRLVHPITEKK